MNGLPQDPAKNRFSGPIGRHRLQFLHEAVNQGGLCTHFQREAPGIFLLRLVENHTCQLKVACDVPGLVNNIEPKASPTIDAIHAADVQCERLDRARYPFSQRPSAFSGLLGRRIDSGGSSPALHGRANLDLNEIIVIVHNSHRDERLGRSQCPISLRLRAYHAGGAAASGPRGSR